MPGRLSPALALHLLHLLLLHLQAWGPGRLSSLLVFPQGPSGC